MTLNVPFVTNIHSTHIKKDNKKQYSWQKNTDKQNIAKPQDQQMKYFYDYNF